MSKILREKYFAASNGVGGFCSYFNEVFSGCRHIFIIKGGPGCGKSRFMSDIAGFAERLGRRVFYYYCSSDASSLDGIIIDGEPVVGFLDGTSPHTFETRIPGAADDIVDLGAFWNSSLLAKRRKEILSLSEGKNAAYARAYSYLAAYGKVVEARDILFRSVSDFTDAAASALADFSPRRDKDEPKSARPAIGLVSSLGMGGWVDFDTYSRRADTIIKIFRAYGLSSRFLSALSDEARRRGFKFELSYSPLFRQMTDNLLLYTDSGNVLFTLSDEERSDFGLSFFEACVGSSLESEKAVAAQECGGLLLHEAEGALRDAGENHFEIERLYFDAMDFYAKEEFTVRFCCSLQNRFFG